MKRIFPSLLAGNILDIPDSIACLSPWVDGFHLDFADGVFTSHPLGSLELISEVQSLTELPLWIHLMVQDPLTLTSQLTIRPHDIVSFHYESISSFHALATVKSITDVINQQGGAASCAISPETPLFSVLSCLMRVPHLKHILLMTVTPGCSGQPLLPPSYERYYELEIYLKKHASHFLTIGLDGGITPSTLATFHITGDRIDLAIGAYVMRSDDKIAAVKNIRYMLA